MSVERIAGTRQDAEAAVGVRPVLWFPRIVLDVLRKGYRDRLLGLAAEIAFFGVLTLFPTLLLVASLLGQLEPLVGVESAVALEAQALRGLELILTDAASPLVATVEGLFDAGSGVFTLSIAISLFSLSTAFACAVNTLNVVAETLETRGWWRRRWIGLLLGLGSTVALIVVGLLVIVGPLLGRADQVVGSVGLGAEYAALWSVARWPVAAAALIAWAWVLLHIAPACRSRWREEWPGALLTAILWLIVSVGLSAYLRFAVPASPVFGSLGGGLILMTWMYLLALGLLGGGTLNAVLQARKRVREGLPAEDPCAVSAAAALAAEATPDGRVYPGILQEGADPRLRGAEILSEREQPTEGPAREVAPGAEEPAPEVAVVPAQPEARS